MEMVSFVLALPGEQTQMESSAVPDVDTLHLLHTTEGLSRGNNVHYTIMESRPSRTLGVTTPLGIPHPPLRIGIQWLQIRKWMARILRRGYRNPGWVSLGDRCERRFLAVGPWEVSECYSDLSLLNGRIVHPVPKTPSLVPGTKAVGYCM
ncbi:hypothetical protein DL96DRAFT_1615939 [Flagelloscypha sp. PMI_526]|nr:hypothetical protein DL96DRAFT_1615939 [Flagelloscypha sp. PMI_526]